MFKSGFVAIVGNPNSGKSTLLNSLLKTKISIISNKKNTTRTQIKGIYNDFESQIIFIDTPGFLKPSSKLDKITKSIISSSQYETDIIMLLLPFWQKLDEDYLTTAKNNSNSKKYLILTKIDKSQNKSEIIEKSLDLQKLNIFEKIIPISSTKKNEFRSLNKWNKKRFKKWC